MLQAEQVLKERYQLEQQLGQTAGRQTWLAKDISTSPTQRVIVKLLAFNPQMHWDELKLFEREAQVLNHLNHLRIPQYRDYFSVDRQDGDGLPWFGLVQEYIPGNSLQQLLEQGKRFTEKQTYKIATSILEILIYLHELSPPVFHRDIKPSNLILGKDGQVYLVDFGAVQDRASAEGVTFTVVGTSGYAPPEQLWGRTVPASDLYALGATLIHLLTGTPPAELPQRQMRIQFCDRVNLSSSFAQWLEQLTEPAPERRFSTARQALLALQASRGSSLSSREASQSVSPVVSYGRLASLALLQVAVMSFAAAIVLPNFGTGLTSNHVTKAKQAEATKQAEVTKQAEAKSYLASINRAQQAYYLEKNAFAESVLELNLSITNQTLNYNYSTQANAWAVFNYGISRQDKLKSYVGGVFLVPSFSVDSNTGKEEMLTRSILCEADSPGAMQLPEPFYENGELVCSPGTREIAR